MPLFLDLLAKIFPFYILIFLGYVAAGRLQINRESIASLVMFIVTPPVIFMGLYNSELTTGRLMLPFIVAGGSSLMAILGYLLAKYFFHFQGNLPNALSFLAGSVNVGYFGLPAATAILGHECMPIVVLVIVGMALFQSTVGFFLAARGQYTWQMSFKKTLSLPVLHAFIVGLFFSKMNIDIGKTLEDFFLLFKGAYSVLGMMMVGMALQQLKWDRSHLPFVSFTILFKFLLWPLVTVIMIALDRLYFHLYTDDNDLTHRTFLVLSSVPIAANSMAYMTHLRLLPEKVALAVVVSTIITFFFLPILMNFLL